MVGQLADILARRFLCLGERLLDRLLQSQLPEAISLTICEVLGRPDDSVCQKTGSLPSDWQKHAGTVI
jgi:hypothetical protein